MILRNPIEEEIIEAIESNVLGYRKWYSRGIKGLELIENEDYFLFNSGLQFVFTNFILNIRIIQESDTKIQKLCSYFKKQNLPFHILVSPNSKPDNIEELLKAQNLILRFQEPGMACDLRTSIDKPVKPKGIDVALVTDSKGKNDWNKTRKIVYKFPKELDEDAFIFHVDDFDGRAYVAYSNNIPIATALSYYEAGVAGLYSITTLPEFRRRGIGKFLTLLLLEDAKKEGYEIVVLQSSTMGKGIYERIGFKEYCNMKFYTWGLEEQV
jgi:GNAT superfamily N-acetyltransferase